jgi:hypothetical protein
LQGKILRLPGSPPSERMVVTTFYRNAGAVAGGLFSSVDELRFVTNGKAALLDLINIVLAAATLVFLLFIIYAGWHGIIEYRQNRSLRKSNLERILSRLGITLPDGGKSIGDEEEDSETPRE